MSSSDLSRVACAPAGMPLRRAAWLQATTARAKIGTTKGRIFLINSPGTVALADTRASDTLQTSIQAVGSFGNESVICVSLAKSGERSLSALSAGICARDGVFARLEKSAHTTMIPRPAETGHQPFGDTSVEK